MSEKNISTQTPPIIFGHSDPDVQKGHLGNIIANQLFYFQELECINISKDGRHQSKDGCLHDFEALLSTYQFGICEASADDIPGQHSINSTKRSLRDLCVASSALTSSYRSSLGTDNKILQYLGGCPQKEFAHVTTSPNKKRFLESQTTTNLAEVRKFAQSAIKIAAANNLEIILLNSDDGWKSEEVFLGEIKKYLNKINVSCRILYGISSNLHRKNSLFVCNFSTGQRAVELLPFVNESVICGAIIQTANKKFYFEEPRRNSGDDLIKKALPLIIGFAEMIGMANPGEKARCNVIIHAALDYYFMSRDDIFAEKIAERLTLHRMLAYVRSASDNIHF